MVGFVLGYYLFHVTGNELYAPVYNTPNTNRVVMLQNSKKCSRKTTSVNSSSSERNSVDGGRRADVMNPFDDRIQTYADVNLIRGVFKFEQLTFQRLH